MNVHIFANQDEIEQNALDQIERIYAYDGVTDVAVFPDIHFCDEKNIPIGVTFSTVDKIYPLITGKDVGCGVAYLKIDKKFYLKPFDKSQHYNALNREHFLMTDEGLGGGNHFLSLEEDEKSLYIMVHTGTRNRGIYMYQRNTELLNEFGNQNYFSIDFLNDKHPDWFDEYSNILKYGKDRRLEFLEKTYRFLLKNKYISECNYETSDSIHNHILNENGKWIHRKGSTELNNDIVVVPLSMTRGSLLVKQKIDAYDFGNINSSSHGAGRKLSRTDTLKHWHSGLKERDRKDYMKRFPELLDRSGKFSKGYLQEFDFAYKDSENILNDQPFLKKVSQTVPICTIKFTEI